MHRRLAIPVAVVAGALATLVAVPVGAQQPQNPSTTTTTAPPPATAPASTTTTTGPGDAGQPPSGEEPPAEQPPPEAPSEEVPEVEEPVPPREEEGGAYEEEARAVVQRELQVAEAEAVELRSAYEVAKAEVLTLQRRLDRLERSLIGLAAEDRDAVRRIEVARQTFESRAANAVIRGRVDEALAMVRTADPNELAIAQALLGSVLDADQQAIDDYLAAKEAVGEELAGLADELVDARLELQDARAHLVDARRANASAQFNLDVFAAGSDIVIHGFVFPVGDPHTFGNSFGAPRMLGTEYEHAHQGVDIMAPAGTPLLACERGIVTRMGTDVLGGIKLWIKGESGTYYYYAHLSGFADGMVDGKVVNPGEIVGFVGDTGNAKGGAPHLHFEIHPNGGAAVNPYPLLKVVDDLAKVAEDTEAS